MSKLLSQNGKILITSVGALAIESTGGGGYDITATENEDGTQSLAIVDGQGGSSGGGSGGTAKETVALTITADFSEYDENYIDVYYQSDASSERIDVDNPTLTINIEKGAFFCLSSHGLIDKNATIINSSAECYFDVTDNGSGYITASNSHNQTSLLDGCYASMFLTDETITSANLNITFWNGVSS